MTLDREGAVPVEGEHAASDGHVHGHLSGHAADHDHLLARVGVEGRVVHVLGPPQLVLRQAGRHHPGSGEKHPFEFLFSRAVFLNISKTFSCNTFHLFFYLNLKKKKLYIGLVTWVGLGGISHFYSKLVIGYNS